jgi:hypothetical protein
MKAIAISSRIIDTALLRFLESSNPDERLELWRLERINTVDSGTWPGNLRAGRGNVYVHIFPTREAEPLDLARDEVWQVLQTLKTPSGSGRGRPTFDGYLITDSYNDEVETYSHWFFDRCVELVIAGAAWQERPFGTTASPEKWILDPLRLQAQIIEAVKVGIEGALRLGAEADFQLGLAITDVMGIEYRVQDRRTYSNRPPSVDRDRLIFPLLALDRSPEESTEVLRPWLDRLWQAGGFQAALK